MKRFFYLVIASLCFLSCGQKNNNSTVVKNVEEVETLKPNEKAKLVKKAYKAVELVDSIIAIYPNLYVNDIQKDRFLKFLYMELDKKLTEDNNFLSEIPLKFSQMLKKGNNKYILKFECGEYSTNDKKLVSEENMTNIDFAIFAEVGEEFASTLVENAKYTLTGIYKGYVNGKLTLPSGKVFNYPNDCYKLDKYGNVCLGGFLFDKINVAKAQ